MMDNTLNLVRLPKEVRFILELLKERNDKYSLEHQKELCRRDGLETFYGACHPSPCLSVT